MEHPNVQRFRDYLGRYATGDLEALRDFYDDGVLWHVAGSHPLSGDYVGKEALLDYFHKVRELTGGTLKLEPESILASDTHLAVFTRVTGERDGRRLDALLAQTFDVGPDGRWTQYFALADDQRAVDAFWS